ncbi:radical SAM family heme chaperone HemW [Anaerosporobacter faecicola]|uniref:radical SAM family heme chaperone HemW n=1 Tax=Anaerosporobacter faecicola TaxID=2718714 RepID=UPI00143989A8|nr:radical SAM family heme chaperone HemW [Anaerosporobacter faecicola]
MNQKKPLGIYIHIPFCMSKCAYCDFLSGPAEEGIQKEYVQALHAQIEAYQFLANEYEVRTIFIGGGTPSSIDATDIKDILSHVYRIFNIDSSRIGNVEIPDNKSSNGVGSKVAGIEITIEANPGTLTKEKLLTYKEAGINRISMGLQSTNNTELRLLGRIHTYEQFEENYHLARECGFNNINVDLMSALPGQTIDTWEATLEKICSLDPEHISAYSLIIEEGTPFYEKYADQEGLPSEEEDRFMYHKTRTMLRDAGYERYEISNYAKPGYESKHNCSYWERIDYIGFGLGASSCIDTIRFHNEEHLQEFIRQKDIYGQNERLPEVFGKDEKVQLLHKLGAKEIHVLPIQEQMEEFMFLGLRMMKGIDIESFNKIFQAEFNTIYGHTVDEMCREGLLERVDHKVRLTERGIDISNYVMSEFLL